MGEGVSDPVRMERPWELQEDPHVGITPAKAVRVIEKHKGEIASRLA